MAIRRVLLAGGCAVGVLLSACGKTQEPPPPRSYTLGDAPSGAPVTPPLPDTGILRDQAAYQPASWGEGPAGVARPGAATAGTVAAARELVTNLLNDLESGEIDLVLAVFAPEQVETLGGNNEFLFNTQQAYHFLQRTLERQYGASSVEQLNSDLRKLVTEKLKVDPVAADTVTVTPNPLLVLLGPQRTPPAMTLTLKDGAWRIRLESKLEEADVAAVQEYHEKLQKAIYAIADALEAKRIEGREAAYAALVQAGLGLDPGLPAAPDEAATPPPGEEQPMTAPADESEKEPEEPGPP